MVARRTIIRAGALAPLAAAGVAGWTYAATASVNLVGYSATGSLSAEELDQLTGRTARVVRVYHHEGAPVPSSLEAAKLLRYLRDENRHVVYSLKVPDSSSATYAACNALAADIAAQGYTGKIWVILWHEPFPELSAADFIARYQAIAPAIRSHGVRCGVCFQVYPIWHKGLDYTTYWPGDAITDFLAIDTYPNDAPSGGLTADPLATIAPLTSFAKGRHKPFGIAEFGIRDTIAAADPTNAVAWIGKFERLGPSCHFTTYWNGGNAGLEHNDGLLVPAYQRLYDHFS